ncbi:MAG: methionine--tRNA ligase [Armatimonadetes bacterium]|nr:methionine--tRNA ligase [Armatimonadota bacterium]
MASEYILVGVAWPYANGPLHLGHIAGAYLPADIFARYHRLAGNHVLMVSGSDQHGTPITMRAEQEGVPPKVIADRYHASFVDCWQRLGVQWELFTATTTENHYKIVGDIFQRLYDRGTIYLDSMEMPFCPKDQKFLADRYVEGTCPYCGYTDARGDQCDNCGRTYNALDLKEPRCKFCHTTPEVARTEHFFCRWSEFNEPLRAWVEDKTYWRKNVFNFTRRYLEEGLKDSAITRDIEWGVPVPIPGYENKRIYVWFDAVIGYYSASHEWAQRSGDPEAWRHWWTNPEARGYYFIGKDNIPFHTLRWPAVLMGCGGLNLPYDVPANEYLNLEGLQFSKSREHAVWVPVFLDRFDPDPLRYYLSINMPDSTDADFSWKEFQRRNNDELAAAYGNLVHRMLTFIGKHYEGTVPPADHRQPEDEALLQKMRDAFPRVGGLLAACDFKDAIRDVMAVCREGNQYLDQQQPWKTIKVDRDRAGAALNTILNYINGLKVLYSPFLPNSSAKLHELLGNPYPASEERWEFRELTPGAALAQGPTPLFKKLEDDIIEEQLALLKKSD